MSSHGRPQVSPWELVNDTDKATAIRALAQGFSLKKAAAMAGRTLPQLQLWATRDPGFRAALLALNTERDHEAVEFRERVRLAAGTMLDELMDLAQGAKQEQVREKAIGTFFKEVYQPHHTPRFSAPTAPTVFISAAQAAILMPSSVDANPSQEPMNGHGSSAPLSQGGDEGVSPTCTATPEQAPVEQEGQSSVWPGITIEERPAGDGSTPGDNGRYRRVVRATPPVTVDV